VQLLRKKGFKAQRMEHGVLDWSARGWPVEHGDGSAPSSGRTKQGEAR
jgi:hypothetical protein